MKAKIYLYITFILTFTLVVSCDDKEDAKPQAAAEFTASKSTAKIGEEIQFTNTSENATAFVWSFGDGTTSKSISPKKAYSSSGEFQVSLLSTGAGGSTISSMTITVLPDPDIFFMESGTALMKRFSIRSDADPATFLDVAGFFGVGAAYDAVHQKIYFSDFEVYGEGKIWSINLDGTDLEAIVEGLYDPYGIALDVEGGKVYWAEDVDEEDIGHIGRANLDGSGKENVVSLDGGWFTAVALDLDNDKMYYIDSNNEDLYLDNLNGTDPDPILPGVYGYGIAVDQVNDKIYFDDQNKELLRRADLDGKNVIAVDDNGSRIYGISIDTENSKIYWSGRDSGEISEADLDGSHKKVLKSGLDSPRGMFLKK